MPDMPYEQPAELLRAIDVLARAVITWMRHESLGQRFRGNPLSAEEQSLLAAGFIASLRTRIGFSDAEGVLVAYAYAIQSRNCRSGYS